MCVKLFLWTLILCVFGGALLSTAFCDGRFRYKPCCTGEQWNSTEGKCVSCPLNHYGENCSFTCSLPEEGYRCWKGHCECNRATYNVTMTSSLCSNYQNLNSTRKPDTSISSVNQVKTRLQDKLGNSGMAAFMFIASILSGAIYAPLYCYNSMCCS